jgi:hypothetical protein
MEGERPMTVNSVLMIRSRVKSGSVAAVEAATRTIFSALEQDPPDGMRFAVSKPPDGETFVILLGLEEGTENPLNKVPAYRAFLGSLKDWLVEPPSQEQLTVVGSYNLL